MLFYGVEMTKDLIIVMHIQYLKNWSKYYTKDFLNV